MRLSWGQLLQRPSCGLPCYTDPCSFRQGEGATCSEVKAAVAGLCLIMLEHASYMYAWRYICINRLIYTYIHIHTHIHIHINIYIYIYIYICVCVQIYDYKGRDDYQHHFEVTQLAKHTQNHFYATQRSKSGCWKCQTLGGSRLQSH